MDEPLVNLPLFTIVLDPDYDADGQLFVHNQTKFVIEGSTTTSLLAIFRDDHAAKKYRDSHGDGEIVAWHDVDGLAKCVRRLQQLLGITHIRLDPNYGSTQGRLVFSIDDFFSALRETITPK